jgi:hypothetical protein
MNRILVAVLVASSVCATVSPTPAAAGDGGAVAAGVIGGLAVGTILGAAASGPRYYAPAPVYVAPPPPAYVVGPGCYWTRGAPVWDGYRGVWFRPRMQVCD